MWGSRETEELTLRGLSLSLRFHSRHPLGLEQRGIYLRSDEIFPPGAKAQRHTERFRVHCQFHMTEYTTLKRQKTGEKWRRVE